MQLLRRLGQASLVVGTLHLVPVLLVRCFHGAVTYRCLRQHPVRLCGVVDRRLVLREHVVDDLLHLDLGARKEAGRDLLERSVLRLGNFEVDEDGEEDHEHEEDEERVRRR